MTNQRDHGGGLDAAVATFGGQRDDWIDLSTGINPVPYPISNLPLVAWAALPDRGARDRLCTAARTFWNVPDTAVIVPTHGASAAISRLPDLAIGHGAFIPTPTYNEHAASFAARGTLGDQTDPSHPTHVYVHPNNPDGRLWGDAVISNRSLTVIDESFCDVCPSESKIAHSAKKGVVILKSFGKFWGLAGLRLGFVIAHPDTLSQAGPSFDDLLGPWSVSGPALHIGTQTLQDTDWASDTRKRLASDTKKLDDLLRDKGAKLVGGTTLFRLYDVDDANAWQHRLAQSHIWSRVFPYSKTFLRLGLPHPDQFNRIKDALS